MINLYSSASVNYSSIRRYSIYSEVQGQTIYKRGATTGVTYGTFDYVEGCLTLPDAEINRICGEGRVKNISLDFGDSGGIVYRPYVGDGGINLIGTLNAGNPKAGTSGYMWYSRINNIISELNLTHIYTN